MGQRLRRVTLAAVVAMAGVGTAAAQDADLDLLLMFPSRFAATPEVSSSSIQVYRIPVGVPLLALDEERRWGLRLTLPVSFSFHEVHAATGFGDLVERFDTVTVTPGLELQLAVASDWLVKPFAEAGVGTATGEGTEVLYAAGVRTVGSYRLEPVRLKVGGAVRYASDRATRARLQDHTTFEVGVDAQLPLGLAVGEREILGGLYGIARFLPDVEVGDERLLELGQIYELGVSVSAEPELRVLGLRLPWVALGYRFGDVFSGVRLSLSFPF